MRDRVWKSPRVPRGTLQRPPRKHLFVSLDLCASQMSSGSGRGFLNLVFDPGRKASTSELLNRCLIHRRRELVH